ncbi:MAG: hypothetical protein GY870_10965 [archaeon]|nr:hypothetical protein [archaeon]
MENNEKWKIKGEISLNMGSEENADIFITSFLPEIKTMPTKRSTLNVIKKESEVIINIKALDITAFRANINSILQFSNAVETIVSYVEKEDQK